jgi:hypothetical protein
VEPCEQWICVAKLETRYAGSTLWWLRLRRDQLRMHR